MRPTRWVAREEGLCSEDARAAQWAWPIMGGLADNGGLAPAIRMHLPALACFSQGGGGRDDQGDGETGHTAEASRILKNKPLSLEATSINRPLMKTWRCS